MGAGSESEKSHAIACPLVSRMLKFSDISDLGARNDVASNVAAPWRHVCQPRESRRYYLGVGTGEAGGPHRQTVRLDCSYCKLL
jgi:hypothetical protein